MRSLFAASLVIVLACFAPEADSQNETPTPLLKPAPTDHSPFLPVAEEAARSKHPDLFRGKFSGSLTINVDMNVAGDVLSISSMQFPAGPVSDRSLSKSQRDAQMEVSVHDAYVRAGAQGIKFLGWYGAKRDNGLYLSYRVLKWPIDPSRSVARVQAAVASAYPQFYRPRLLSAEGEDSTPSIMTVVMNDDGTIAGATIVENPTDEDSSDRVLFDRFRALGLKVEELAYRGRTTNQGDFQDKNLSSPLVLIEYAWRRRDTDPVDEILQSHDVFERVSLLHMREQQSHPSDEALFERYFADVWKNGLPNKSQAVWLLFARDGRVLDRGIVAESDLRAVEELLSRKHRDVRISENSISGVRTNDGSIVSLYCVWLAPDSPTIPKASLRVDR